MRLIKSNMRLYPKKISKPFLRNAIMIGMQQQQKSVCSGHGLGRRSTWLPCASHHPCGRELLLHPLSPSEMLFRGLFRSTKISSPGLVESVEGLRSPRTPSPRRQDGPAEYILECSTHILK
ncbi:hypothetical protein CEXT_640341 [Caerostris extrusa]|uniref:Ycf15 n=1 Tax=Caerostris extrusa TaxID=172846 RepID=A0AAV4VM30_CAEEX|nr:hypothetical protein CEXT_640341 [Caerostris extrusa]